MVEDDVVVVGDFCAGRRGQRGFAHPVSVRGIFQFLGDGGDRIFDDGGDMRSIACWIYLQVGLYCGIWHSVKPNGVKGLENSRKHAHRKQWESLH